MLAIETCVCLYTRVLAQQHTSPQNILSKLLYMEAKDM